LKEGVLWVEPQVYLYLQKILKETQVLEMELPMSALNFSRGFLDAVAMVKK
jgi:hypothetical protein